MPVPLIFALPFVVVQSSSSCPTTVQIELELAALSDTALRDGERDQIRVREQGDQLLIELVADSGAVLAEKELSADDDCQVLARAVAVTVATWMTVFREQKEATARDEAIRTAPPGADDPAQRPTKPTEPHSEEERSSGAPPEQAEGFTVELSGAFGAALDVGDSAASALVAASIRRGRWGTQFALRYEAPREFALQRGIVSYSRPSAILSINWQSPPAWVSAEAGLGVGLALVRVEGFGFSTNAVASDVEVSAEAYCRTYLLRGAVRPFIQGAFSLWPVPQVALLDATSGPIRSELPAWSSQLAIGIAAFL